MERERERESSVSALHLPLHPFRAFSSAYFLPRRGCRSCHKFRQPWRVSYFEYEMNYVPLLPDMAYGMGRGWGLFFFERSSFFSFFWSIFQGKLKILEEEEEELNSISFD